MQEFSKMLDDLDAFMLYLCKVSLYFALSFGVALFIVGSASILASVLDYTVQYIQQK
jgi:hypothetical protein